MAGGQGAGVGEGGGETDYLDAEPMGSHPGYRI